LPDFDGPVMEATYAALSGTPLTEEQASAWSSIGKLAARFHAVDALVLTASPWNFGIPYRLEHLIDVVSQKDLLLTVEEALFGPEADGASRAAAKAYAAEAVRRCADRVKRRRRLRAGRLSIRSKPS
jgi:FMN-dependent NADH-azoreductase